MYMLTVHTKTGAVTLLSTPPLSNAMSLHLAPWIGLGEFNRPHR